MVETTKETISYTGKLRFVRTSSTKAGQVLALIRGKSFNEARFILQFTPKKAARLILKLLESIGANARNRMEEHRPNLDDLYVKLATADQGPTYPPRMLPRAYGRATPILKRTAHIAITLAERTEAVLARAEKHAKKSRRKK